MVWLDRLHSVAYWFIIETCEHILISYLEFYDKPALWLDIIKLHSMAYWFIIETSEHMLISWGCVVDRRGRWRVWQGNKDTCHPNTPP